MRLSLTHVANRRPPLALPTPCSWTSATPRALKTKFNAVIDPEVDNEVVGELGQLLTERLRQWMRLMNRDAL
jgi:hypothetical protein